MTATVLATPLGFDLGAAQAAPSCRWVNKQFPPNPNIWVSKKAELDIPAIGLYTPVTQGWFPDINSEASHALMHGPAFYPQGMVYGNHRYNHLPGQGGTVGMLGHRTTRTHPFCLVRNIYRGNRAILKMPYGTFVYTKVGSKTTKADDWSVFADPTQLDPDPETWHSGIKPEYLVTGACDPPGSDGNRDNDVFKLIQVYWK